MSNGGMRGIPFRRDDHHRRGRQGPIDLVIALILMMIVVPPKKNQKQK